MYISFVKQKMLQGKVETFKLKRQQWIYSKRAPGAVTSEHLDIMTRSTNKDDGNTVNEGWEQI